MKPLPREFRKDGFDCVVERRVGDVAMIRKCCLAHVSYEVVIVQRHNGRLMAGKFIEPAEHMPSSEQWGSAGWTFSDRPSAVIKFDRLSLTDEDMRTLGIEQ